MTDLHTWQAIQRKCGVRPDGIPGPATATAIAEHLGIDLTDHPQSAANRWPIDNAAAMLAFYGDIGTGHTQITPPYPLLYEGRPLKTITVHGRIALDVTRALEQVLSQYGHDEIKRLRLNRFDGCYNPRKKRGGTTWSTHAFAAALDFAAEHNQLNQDHRTALFAKPEYEAWWRAWENVGALSLGRTRDFDWMHIQFARLP